jgi:DUF4097 and DUF4098 domain-containing protein YvlB
MPPGGGRPPIPPYDAKTQWRIHREQQKAAWRAQREAWKAQRHAIKADYAGVYGPRVPSVVGPIILIAIGIVALLMMTGRIAAPDFWAWYAHWWPLLLIGAGLALLAEWAIDLKREVPVRRGGSFVGILILLAIVGFGAAGWNNFLGPLHAQWGDHGDDFFNAFGLPEHDNDHEALNTAIPANSAIEIQNPRGDISITAGDGPNIVVDAHEVAFANSDTDAKKIFDAEAPNVKVSGNAVLVKSDSNSSGRLNLTITVPKSAHVTVTAGHGDVTAAGLGSGIHFNSHGDVHLSSIAGTVEAHFVDGKHDFSAHDVQGDVSADGDCNDLTLSEIKGKITQNGEILGDVHMENIAGAVHLHTSITDLQLASLPGDLTMNSDDLRVTESKGQVRVTTHSKDIDLGQIAGDIFVENRNGRIAIEPTGSFAIEAKNSKGDVEVTLPPNASVNVEAHTHNGDILNDYGSTATEGNNSAELATFRVGAGGPKIYLSADNGDVHIKKGSGFASVPSMTKVAPPPTPDGPEAPAAPHLKAPKTAPRAPVTQ